MNTLGITLIWCSIQVTMIGLLAFGFHALVRGRRQLGSTVSFLTLLTIAAITFAAFLPIPSWFERPTTALVEPIATTNGNQPTSDDREIDRQPLAVDVISSLPPTPTFGELFLEELSTVDWTVDAPPRQDWTWQGIVACIFIAFAAIGGGQWLIGVWWVYRFRRCSKPLTDPVTLALVAELSEAIEANQSTTAPAGHKCKVRPVEIRTCDAINSAATIGWIQPLVFLPKDWRSWNATHLRCVLAHELAHIHRRDFAACVLGQLSVAFHFYHPLVHWLVARLKLEQELSADALAATVVGDGRTYLTSLAEMALLQDSRQDNPAIWPARPFLPTGKTLMRRIEILKRANGKTSYKIPAVLKYGAAIAIVFAAVIGMGLRGPAGILPPPAVAQDPVNPATTPPAPTGDEIPDPVLETEINFTAAKKAPARKSLPHSLAYVPRDTVIVASLRPAKILENSSLTPLTKVLKESNLIPQSFGVELQDIDQATILIISNEDERMKTLEPSGIVIRMRSPAAVDQFCRKVGAASKSIIYDGQAYIRATPAEFFYFVVGETTIVASVSEPGMRQMIIAGATGANSAPWVKVWKELPDDDFVVHWDMELFRPNFPVGPVYGQPSTPRLGINRLLELSMGMSSLALTAQLKDGLNLRLLAHYSTEEQTKHASGQLGDTVGWMRQSLSKLRREVSQDPSPEGAIGLRATSVLDSLIDNRIVTANTTTLVVESRLTRTQFEQMVGSVAPAVQAAKSAAYRVEGMNNLRQIGLAMHNYHADFGHLPSTANYFMADQKTKSEHPHSWRVALLPYLAENLHYTNYKFDEPWDSINNKKILAQMPKVYRNPAEANQRSTNSDYYVLTGPDSVFPNKPGSAAPRFANIIDGLSNTIMAVESKFERPWTQPIDIAYDKDKPLTRLGGIHKDGINVGICDGSVKFILYSIDEGIMRALITPAGKEPPQGRVPTRPQPGRLIVPDATNGTDARLEGR